MIVLSPPPSPHHLSFLFTAENLQFEFLKPRNDIPGDLATRLCWSPVHSPAYNYPQPFRWTQSVVSHTDLSFPIQYADTISFRQILRVLDRRRNMSEWWGGIKLQKFNNQREETRGNVSLNDNCYLLGTGSRFVNIPILQI